MAIVPMTLFIFLFSLIFGHVLGLVVLLVKYQAQIKWVSLFKATPYIIPFLLVYAFAFALAISLFYPCGITSAGVFGHSFWGLRRHLGWGDISTAKRIRMGNLSFLRLYNAGGTVIWLPLFQSERLKFLETIRKCAPPGHPILNHLG